MNCLFRLSIQSTQYTYRRDRLEFSDYSRNQNLMHKPHRNCKLEPPHIIFTHTQLPLAKTIYINEKMYQLIRYKKTLPAKNDCTCRTICNVYGLLGGNFFYIWNISVPCTLYSPVEHVSVATLLHENHLNFNYEMRELFDKAY